MNDAAFLGTHDKDVLVKTGYFVVQWQTNLNVNLDLEKIENNSRDYSERCLEARRKMSNIWCDSSAKWIEQSVEMAKKILHKQSSLAKTRRIKRDTGIITSLWHFVFGRNDENANEIAAKATGVIKHSINVFSVIEEQLIHKEQSLDKELKQLTGNVEYESSKIIEYANKVNIQLIEIRNQIMDNIQFTIDERNIS